MSQVVVNGLMTEYSLKGKGKVVLLLHGWGDDHRTFAGLEADLTSSYQVVAVDLPGFGKTASPESVWGLDDYAQFVGDFMKKISLSSYGVIGHSNGGAILVRALATEKLTADRLILLASSGIRGEYKGRNMLLRLITKTGKLIVWPLPKKIKTKLRSKLYSTVGSDMLVAEHLQDTFKKVVTDDVRADAARVTTKSLLIYGDKDSATPVKYAQLLADALPNSELVVLPGAGHFIHTEEADMVNSRIKGFLG